MKGATNRNSPAERKPKQFQPDIGSDFGNITDSHERNRTFLVRMISLAAVAFLAVAGVFGLYTGNFNPVAGVWMAAGPVIAAIVGYYFGAKGNNTG